MNYLVYRRMEPSAPGVYPTREEILAERPMYRWGLFKVLSDWKREFYKHWSNQSDEDKREGLQVLAGMICRLYRAPDTPTIYFGEADGYVFAEGTIWLTKPSIITMLHELGHHLFGQSELHACRFSVWIYQLRFGSAMSKLIWQGHRLIEK